MRRYALAGGVPALQIVRRSRRLGGQNMHGAVTVGDENRGAERRVVCARGWAGMVVRWEGAGFGPAEGCGRSGRRPAGGMMGENRTTGAGAASRGGAEAGETVRLNAGAPRRVEGGAGAQERPAHEAWRGRARCGRRGQLEMLAQRGCTLARRMVCGEFAGGAHGAVVDEVAHGGGADRRAEQAASGGRGDVSAGSWDAQRWAPRRAGRRAWWWRRRNGAGAWQRGLG